MKAAVTKRLGTPFVVEEVELYEPGPRDIVVRTGAAAYCTTDTLNRDGRLGKQDQTVFGHSAVGVVERVGSDVRRVRVGDRVLCGGSPECGECPSCVRHRPDQCVRLAEFGLPLGRGADGLEVLTCPVGGYAELMRIPEFWAHPLRSSLPDELLCMLGCGITSGVGAVLNIARVDPGSSVAVVGCGQLGLWMIQGAGLAGATRIIAVDPHATRRDLAAQLGATDLVDPAAGDAVAEVKKLTGGRGADYTLEAAGTAEGFGSAIRMTSPIGVVVLSGVQGAGATVTLDMIEISVRGREIRNSQNGRCSYARDVPLFVDLLERGKLTAEPLVAGRFGLADLNRAAELTTSFAGLTPVVVPSLETA
jgi:S-(hydroxymethyl)glutathione dehydrogenase/alcohol dehydrogenase